VQLVDKELHKSFTAIHSKGKAVIGAMIFGKAMPFYGQMKVTDRVHSLREVTKNYLYELRSVKVMSDNLAPVQSHGQVPD
jgi:hypothetical protein